MEPIHLTMLRQHSFRTRARSAVRWIEADRGGGQTTLHDGEKLNTA